MTSAHLAPVPVTVRVPGKVNLELLVGGLRPDGFHSLSTVFQAVSLHDDVTVVEADDWGCTVTGPLAVGVPESGDNLAVRAARALARVTGIAFVLSLVANLYPSWRASRVNPAEALRYE